MFKEVGMKKLLLFFLILFSVFNSYANELKVIDLAELKWEYKWGDSPFEHDIPLWTKNEVDTSVWKTISYPTNPPNRDGQTNVWYRVKIPETLPLNPHVYVFSMDIIPEVYYKNKLIYSFGKLDKEGKGEFAGWPWHMFSIPSDSMGEYLYFRIYSNYLDIGLFGEISIASKGQIIKEFLDNDISKIMVSSISIFVAVIFLLSFLSKFIRVELFILGSLFLTQGLNILCSVKVIQMYLFFPLLNQYILAASFFYFPVGMALFMDKTIDIKVPLNLIKRIWQVHLLYIFGAFSGSILGFYEIPATYEYFDMLYYFGTLPILTIFMIYFFIKGNNEVKLITSSFLIISIYWIYSFLVAYHIVPWTEYPSDLAIFYVYFFILFDNKKLNYTNKLEDEKKELTILSSTDYLTKLYNRKEIDELLKRMKTFLKIQDDFSIILLDIDDFKKINDTKGHLIGDKFLVDLGNILTTFTRDTDQVGRWGGEEFIIICSKTKKEEAIKVAENLRFKIESHNFNKAGHKTASFGVSTYMEEDSIAKLLSRADEAMYKSKEQGKNRVNFK